MHFFCFRGDRVVDLGDALTESPPGAPRAPTPDRAPAACRRGGWARRLAERSGRVHPGGPRPGLRVLRGRLGGLRGGRAPDSGARAQPPGLGQPDRRRPRGDPVHRSGCRVRRGARPRRVLRRAAEHLDLRARPRARRFVRPALLPSTCAAGRDTDDEARDDRAGGRAGASASESSSLARSCSSQTSRWERMRARGSARGGGVALALAVARGRARAYVAPAVLAVVLGAGLVASGARLEGGVGDVTLRGRRRGGRSLVVRRAVGDVTVDLRQGRCRPAGDPGGVGGQGQAPRRRSEQGPRSAVDAHVGQGRIYAGLVNRGSQDAVRLRQSACGTSDRTRELSTRLVSASSPTWAPARSRWTAAENFETAAVR